VFVGLRATPDVQENKGDSPAPNDESQAVERKSVPVAEPKTKLYLPGVAVVNLTRLVAAHPRTASYDELLAEKLSDAQTFLDAKTRTLAKTKAEMERDECRKLIVRDIQGIITAYAATNAFTLVLDRSANLVPGRPVVEYSTNAVQFLDVATASGVKDITPAILQLLQSEPPNHRLPWAQR